MSRDDGRARLDRVIERLAAAGIDMRDQGDDVHRGDCPSCGGEDRLVVRLDFNQAVGFRCWGQCTHGAIAQVLGLSDEDLRGRREPASARVTFATSVKAERVRWLVPGRIPLGAVSLVAGDPKLGKSTLTCLYAAGVTLGRYGDPATVLIISAEDSFARVIKPRAHAAGAALDRVGMFEVVDEDGPRFPDLPEDVDALTGAIAEHKAKLVVVDPLNAFLSGQLDSWKDHGIRRALAPLARLAESQDCAVVVVVHLNKQSGGNPLYRVNGSIGQVGAARSVLAFGRDPEDPDGDRGSFRLLGHLASNWGRLEATEQYQLQTVAVELDDQLIETSRLIYRGETDQAAGDAFGTRPRDERAGDCEDAIAEQLADGEARMSHVVKTAVMKELGVSEKTVKRAAKRMKDRGELLVEEAGGSDGQANVRRATTWRLHDRVTPIAVRDPIVGNDGAEPKTASQNPRSGHASNGDPIVTPSSDDPIVDGHADDFDEALRRVRENPPPDPPWKWW